MGEMAALLHELEQLRQHCDDQGAELQRLTRRNVTFLHYRERKLRKFSGAETFEEWEVDAQAAISWSGMSLEEQSGFLFNKLEGDAKREIICRGGPTVLTPDQLVLALGEVGPIHTDHGVQFAYDDLYQRRVFHLRHHTFLLTDGGDFKTVVKKLLKGPRVAFIGILM